MTAREYLQTIKSYKYQINQYLLQLEELYNLLNAGAIDYSKDHIQTSPVNQMEEVLIRIDEIRNNRLKTVLNMELFIDEATAKINELTNEGYREVLTERFVNLKKFDAIADKLSIENQSARKLCMVALNNFGEVHKEFLGGLK